MQYHLRFTNLNPVSLPFLIIVSTIRLFATALSLLFLFIFSNSLLYCCWNLLSSAFQGMQLDNSFIYLFQDWELLDVYFLTSMSRIRLQGICTVQKFVWEIQGVDSYWQEEFISLSEECSEINSNRVLELWGSCLEEQRLSLKECLRWIPADSIAYFSNSLYLTNSCSYNCCFCTLYTSYFRVYSCFSAFNFLMMILLLDLSVANIVFSASTYFFKATPIFSIFPSISFFSAASSLVSFIPLLCITSFEQLARSCSSFIWYLCSIASEISFWMIVISSDLIMSYSMFVYFILSLNCSYFISSILSRRVSIRDRLSRSLLNYYCCFIIALSCSLLITFESQRYY